MQQLTLLVNVNVGGVNNGVGTEVVVGDSSDISLENQF